MVWFILKNLLTVRIIALIAKKYAWFRRQDTNCTHFYIIQTFGGYLFGEGFSRCGVIGWGTCWLWCFLSKAANETRMRSMITAKDKYLQFSSMHPYCKSIVAKQCVQEGTVFWQWTSHWCLKIKNLHLTFIISDSVSSRMEPFTNAIGAFAVAKIGVSLLNSMSWLYAVFGAAKWTMWPANSSRKSLHGIMVGRPSEVIQKDQLFVLDTKPCVRASCRRKEGVKNMPYWVKYEGLSAICWTVYVNIAAFATTHHKQFNNDIAKHSSIDRIFAQNFEGTLQPFTLANACTGQLLSEKINSGQFGSSKFFGGCLNLPNCFHKFIYLFFDFCWGQSRREGYLLVVSWNLQEPVAQGDHGLFAAGQCLPPQYWRKIHRMGTPYQSLITDIEYVVLFMNSTYTIHTINLIYFPHLLIAEMIETPVHLLFTAHAFCLQY